MRTPAGDVPDSSVMARCYRDPASSDQGAVSRAGADPVAGAEAPAHEQSDQVVAAFSFASVRLRTASSIPTPRNLVCSVLRHGIGLPSGGYPRNSLETLEVTEHRRF